MAAKKTIPLSVESRKLKFIIDVEMSDKMVSIKTKSLENKKTIKTQEAIFKRKEFEAIKRFVKVFFS